MTYGEPSAEAEDDADSVRLDHNCNVFDVSDGEPSAEAQDDADSVRRVR